MSILGLGGGGGEGVVQLILVWETFFMLARSICTVDGMDTTTFNQKFLISHASTPEMDSGFNLNL